MTQANRLGTLCLLALALSACGKKAASEQDAAAVSQVLPGSVSDAMLPQDTASSQPPLVRKADAAGDGGEAPEGGESSESGAVAADRPAPVDPPE